MTRHRLLARRWAAYDSGTDSVVLECGHSISPRESAGAFRAPRGRDGRLRYYCPICATSPHRITNPEAWEKLRGAVADHWRMCEVAKRLQEAR